MERRKESAELRALYERVIEKNPFFSYIRDEGIRITFLESDARKKSKGKSVYGECEKVPDKYKWAIASDFTITFYEENIAGLSAVQREILMEHELMHVGYENGKCRINPHDTEDFEWILRKYGLCWESVEKWQNLKQGGMNDLSAAEKREEG